MKHEDCRNCAFGDYAFSVGMDGRGPLNAKVLLVAMSPGKNEDAAGTPMVGSSGKLLDSMLMDAGFDPAELRITNAVRCHSKDNKVFPANIEACRQWLIDEIHEVKPEVIIAMGDVALTALCKRSGIQGKRGTAIPLHGDFNYACDVYATYHPAYVLRTLPARSTVVSDLSRVCDRTKVAETIKWEWWSGVLPEAEVFAWDVETGYVIDKTRSDVIQCAVSCLINGEEKTYVARKLTDIRQMLEALIEKDNSGKTLVTHNGWKADCPWANAFLASGAGVPSDQETSPLEAPLGDDTIVFAYLEDETQPRGLESLCVKFLGVVGWKEGLHADPDSDAFAEYNARDAVFTRRLHSHLLTILGVRRAISDRIIKPAFRALELCSKTGIYIDSEAVQIALTHYGPILDELRTVVCDLSPLEARITNPNSPQQVGAALIAEGHFLPLTDQGLPSTKASAVAELRPTKLTEALSDYREAAKLMGTYIKPYQAIAALPEPRVHSIYGTFTVTGRTSASKLNVQNLPRNPMIRDFFSAAYGHELCEIDYSSIEFRLAAMIANEKGILARYDLDPDWDAHTFVACRYFNIPEEEGLRLKKSKDVEFAKKRNNVAKSANFGLLFGSSAPGLYEYAKKVALRPEDKLTLDQCIDIREFWHATFPGFFQYYIAIYDEIQAYGYVESLTGRRRHVGDTKLMNQQTRAAVVRECANFKVQSLAADIALLALGLCVKYGQPIVGFIHDAILYEYPLGVSVMKFEGLKRLMVNEPLRILREEFGAEITVPLLVEMKLKPSKVLVAA